MSKGGAPQDIAAKTLATLTKAVKEERNVDLEASEHRGPDDPKQLKLDATLQGTGCQLSSTYKPRPHKLGKLGARYVQIWRKALKFAVTGYERADYGTYEEPSDDARTVLGRLRWVLNSYGYSFPKKPGKKGQATNAWFFEDPQYQLADANCAVQQYLEEEEEKEADQARRARAQGKGAQVERNSDEGEDDGEDELRERGGAQAKRLPVKAAAQADKAGAGGARRSKSRVPPDTDDSDNQGGAVKGQDGAMADKPARDSCTVSAAAAAANKQGGKAALRKVKEEEGEELIAPKPAAKSAAQDTVNTRQSRARTTHAAADTATGLGPAGVPVDKPAAASKPMVAGRGAPQRGNGAAAGYAVGATGDGVAGAAAARTAAAAASKPAGATAPAATKAQRANASSSVAGAAPAAAAGASKPAARGSAAASRAQLAGDAALKAQQPGGAAMPVAASPEQLLADSQMVVTFLTSENAQLQLAAVAANARIDQLTAANKQLTADVAQLTQELSANKDTAEKQLAAATTIIEQLQTQLSEAINRAEQLAAEKSAAVQAAGDANRAAAEQHAAAACATNEQLQREIAELRQQLGEAELKTSEAMYRVRSSDKCIYELQQQLESAQSVVSECQKSAQEAKGAQEAMRVDNLKVLRRLGACGTARDSALREAAEERAAKQQLQLQVEQQQAQLGQLQLQLVQLQAASQADAAAAASVPQLQQQLADARGELKAVSADKARLATELEELRSSLDFYTTDLVGLSAGGAPTTGNMAFGADTGAGSGSAAQAQPVLPGLDNNSSVATGLLDPLQLDPLQRIDYLTTTFLRTSSDGGAALPDGAAAAGGGAGAAGSAHGPKRL